MTALDESPFGDLDGLPPWERMRQEWEAGQSASRTMEPKVLAEAISTASEREENAADEWEDLTHRHYDFIAHVVASKLPHADRTLATAMALHCGPNSHGCSASTATLAAETRIDRRDVRERLRKLEKAGLIRHVSWTPPRAGATSGTKVYRIGRPK
ncbi:helix-turn-helix domain-containing protein [Streptomyces sp. BPTC-684]|uniref:helix-turn-helix domain-containing protein n=1 Tax=Streptomyces sp. BPTC-684 TaxID=3043734 RepID=UPI0024B0ED32|nr:helix-turn-helix domain-containing protein [Streptomyces sp. BPTC-684]WHM35628.1 helix-turn-helix domain-containing protein [Streptomyces sp. BPTC-684]